MYPSLGETRTLDSGYDMPIIGLGTWQLQGPDCEHVVAEAIEIGYRAIDTAELYDNEAEVGHAIRPYPRDELFLTSKVSNNHLAPLEVIAACQASLGRLGTDYLDLYLIHWPNDERPLKETLDAMNELVRQGWVRSIGVSNFDVYRLTQALDASEKPICNNQIEYHPYTHRRRLPAFCGEHYVAVTAYSPLARGKVLDDAILSEIGRTHGKSPAQVSLKWLLQQGVLVVPKASRTGHLHANADMAGWALGQEEMDRIASIESEVRVVDHVYT